MRQFEEGDRVVIKGGPSSPVKAGEKGTVERFSYAGSNTVFIRTDRGPGFWLRVSDLELDDSPAGLGQ